MKGFMPHLLLSFSLLVVAGPAAWAADSSAQTSSAATPQRATTDRGEAGEGAGPAADQSRAKEAGKINVNQASAQRLATRLSGVGPVRAKAIVRYREREGGFTQVDELVQVDGIGDATLEDNRAVLKAD